jgi:hypothetical protein
VALVQEVVTIHQEDVGEIVQEELVLVLVVMVVLAKKVEAV